ncbi:MAG: hypothetical protein AAGC93_30350, partial [Cyanobacteria bacterium P01_F01_bin.53]
MSIVLPACISEDLSSSSPNPPAESQQNMTYAPIEADSTIGELPFEVTATSITSNDNKRINAVISIKNTSANKPLHILKYWM